MMVVMSVVAVKEGVHRPVGSVVAPSCTENL